MSPGTWALPMPGVLWITELEAGRRALCGALDGMAFCVLSLAGAFFGGLLVKGKLEREGA